MKFFITDVFGNEKYSGNQLATFFDFGAISAAEMQKIAHEINFSETTFITSSAKKDGGYDVRIFTPKSEIDFAGHPVLGTAYILSRYLEDTEEGTINLNLKVGQIPITIDGETLWMRQNQPKFGNNMDVSMLSKVLGLADSEIDNRFPIQEVTTGLPFTIVPVKTLQSLKSAKVNLEHYDQFVKRTWAKGILIFSTETYEKNHDLSSRVFVHYLGIPEDPATGSATGCLAAYLLKNSVFDSEKIDISIGQGYELNRPSELRVKANKKGDNYEINVGGKVIEIAEGDWKINAPH